MDELMKLPNVGKVLAGNLIKSGITTPEELYRVGAKEAFLRIRREVDPEACLHMLYGIKGAILGIPDSELPEDVREDLRAFFKSL